MGVNRMRFVLYFCLSILVFSCGGSSDNERPPDIPDSHIHGAAINGLIEEGTICLYDFSDGVKGRLLGDECVQTQSNGEYTLSAVSVSGPVLLELTGGQYMDEYSGEVIQVNGRSLQTVFNLKVGENQQVQMNAFTTLSACLARYRSEHNTSASVKEHVQASNRDISDFFGVSDIVESDVSNVIEGRAIGTPLNDALLYGYLLSGFSGFSGRAAEKFDVKPGSSEDYTSIRMISLACEDIEADGTLDGFGSTHLSLGKEALTGDTYRHELMKGVMTIIEEDINQAGIQRSDVLQHLNSISSHPTQLVAGEKNNLRFERIDEVVISDDSLRSCIENLGLTYLYEVKTIDCASDEQPVSNIDGLEKFFNLRVLNLSGQELSGEVSLLPFKRLTVLDLSANNIDSVRLDYSWSLLDLDLSLNAISEVNLEALENLEDVNLSSAGDLADRLIQSLDLQKNTKLAKLIVNHQNISEIELSNNIDIYHLELSANSLSDINISMLDKLQHLDLSFMSTVGQVAKPILLQNLEITSYPLLTHLNLSNNLNLNKDNLDFSESIELAYLNFSEVRLDDMRELIDLKKLEKLKFLDVSHNNLTSVDISHNLELETLYVNDNVLEGDLDFIRHEDLALVHAQNNNLELVVLNLILDHTDEETFRVDDNVLLAVP